MANQKHTPGPWRLEIDKNGGDWRYTIRDELNSQIASINRYAALNTGVTPSCYGNMIAAAPELLAALRTAFEFIAQHSSGNPYMTEPGKTAAAAIAKAEGRTP